MNVYEVTFSNGTKLLQFAISYPDCLRQVQKYNMAVLFINLVKGSDDTNIIESIAAGAS